DNTCTHRGGPLCEGEVSGEEVTCPWHGAVYNIKTGAVLGPPAPRGVARYPVRVQGSDVAVEVEVTVSWASLGRGRWRRKDRSSEPKPIPRSAPCVPTAARAYRPKWAIPTR